jgi:membrane peptidoglycan carboxypeptidase
LTRTLLIIVAVLSSIGATAVGVVFASYNIYKSELPDATTIVGMEPAQDSYVYDAKNTLIYVYNDQGYRHTHVALSNVSHWVKLATIDVEDRHFFEEGSWDLPRLVAAGVNNLTHNGATQGASTITEQLAKISLYGGATPPRSIDYKVKEIVLGNEIELNFTKDQILEMYLNRIYYGNHATGIETAAEIFFHKPASQLDLAEASMLAGLPKSPGLFNPFNHDASSDISPLTKQRQRDVLSAMVINGDITAAQEHAAYTEKLSYYLWTDSEPNANNPNQNLSFLSFLTDWLNSNYGSQYIKPGGWRIYTTLDPARQALADQTVQQQVDAVTARTNMYDGALVNLDPKTGEVLAMTGAAHYDDAYSGQVNYADAPINPGSTIKLFTYTAAIASGKFTMTTPVVDAPYSFPIPNSAPYSPFDYDRQWHGTCVVKTCLGNSFNMPAVKVEYATGIPYITNLEMAMGVHSIDGTCRNYKGDLVSNRPLSTYYATTLGSLTCGITLLDLADGAATLADLGIHHDPMPVTRITENLTGHVIFNYDANAAGRRVVPNNVAYIMDEITSNDNNRLREFGPHGYLTLGDRRVSAKTGTADYFLDNLTVGWTPDTLTAVWVGNGTKSCLKGADYPAMARAIARGDVYPVPGDYVTDTGYPFTPRDLAHYHLQPVHTNCGHLDGIVSGYSGAAPIWHLFMDKVTSGTPMTWYQRPPDVIATGPTDNADFYLPGTNNPYSGCDYWGPAPDPSNSCTYLGLTPPAGYVPPTPVPTPTPTPSPIATMPVGLPPGQTCLPPNPCR